MKHCRGSTAPLHMKRSGCGVIRSIESDAPVTMVHPSAPCTTQSHSTLHLVTSRWSWVLGSSGAAAAFGVRMMRVSKESPSVARAAQTRCALMRRVAYMACAKHLPAAALYTVTRCRGVTLDAPPAQRGGVGPN